MGVSLAPGFQACVRIHLPNGWEMWDFAERHGPYKTFKAAREACEHHRQLWSNVAKASGVRHIQELCGRVPIGYPLWIRKEMSAKVRIILETVNKPQRERECEPDQSAPIETSPNIEQSKTGDKPSSSRRGRVLPAVGEAATPPNTNVLPAEAPVKERKRRSSLHTARKLTSTGKKKKITRRLSKRK